MPKAEAASLAIKPQMLDAAGPVLKRLAHPDALVVLDPCRKTIEDVAQRMEGSRRIVRAMPNLPASVRRGVTAAVADPSVTPPARKAWRCVAARVGAVEWIDGG